MATLLGTSVFLILCWATVAALVFLTASQPFLLSTLFPEKPPGSASGKLSLVDELVAMSAAPIWGSLADNIGVRPVASLGMSTIAVSIWLYPHARSFAPSLLLLRALFAIGAASAVSMMTAVLSHYAETPASAEIEPLLPNSDGSLAIHGRNARMAGFVGLFSGIGAVFAVTVLLPLPSQLSGGGRAGLVSAYAVVGSGLAVVAVLMLLWLPSLARSLETRVSLRAGFDAAKTEPILRWAYYSSAISRALSVTITLFLPLWINAYYRSHDMCGVGSGSNGNECRPAVVRAAIITGTANTAALFCAPVAGWLCARKGALRTLSLGAMLAVMSLIGLVLYRCPTGLCALALAVILGCAQMLVMASSLTLCSSGQQRLAGSVAGVASLCGGLGNLVLTQTGGPLADSFVSAPFMVMVALLIPALAA